MLDLVYEMAHFFQGDSLIAAPLGILGLLPFIAFAIWLAVTGRLKPLPDTATETTSSSCAIS